MNQRAKDADSGSDHLGSEPSWSQGLCDLCRPGSPCLGLGFLIYYEMRVTYLNPQKAMEGGGFKPTSEILIAVTSCM